MHDHPVEALFQVADAMRYPDGVTPTWARIANPEFFPGGYGLWNARAGEPLPPLPSRGVVVLGHNLDSVESFTRTVGMGGVDPATQVTFRNLRRLLDAAGIDVGDVFLTNFFMGCGMRQTGPFPGRRDPAFVEDCQALLRQTLQLLQPRVLVVLGRETWPFLEGVARGLGAWRGVKGFAHLDASALQVLGPVTTPGAAPFAATSVVHPSFAHANWRHRRFGEHRGLAAESAALREALARTA